MSEKTVNYSNDDVVRMKEVYDGEASVEDRDTAVAQLAQELGRSAASIRAKLTHLGVYVPKGTKTSKAKAVSKAEIVTAIAKKLGVAEEIVGSLEKATKVTLVKIQEAL